MFELEQVKVLPKACSEMSQLAYLFWIPCESERCENRGLKSICGGEIFINIGCSRIVEKFSPMTGELVPLKANSSSECIVEDYVILRADKACSCIKNEGHGRCVVRGRTEIYAKTYFGIFWPC